MSAKQANRKMALTIALVSLMLVGVVALNINTFGGMSRGSDSARGYRLQAHPPVPSDMGQMMKHAIEIRPAENSLEAGPVATSLKRDPFFPTKAQHKPVMKNSTHRRKTTTKPKARVNPLECSAIMLGGKLPMAIINGEGRHPGDSIQGMVLVGIDADGVTFRKSDGSITHLSVGVPESENQNYRVITRTRELDDQGRTSLVNQ